MLFTRSQTLFIENTLFFNKEGLGTRLGMASLLAEGWVSSLYLYPSDQYCGYNSTTLDCYQ